MLRRKLRAIKRFKKQNRKMLMFEKSCSGFGVSAGMTATCARTARMRLRVHPAGPFNSHTFVKSL